MKNSVKILMGFLVLLAVSLVYTYINWPRQARVTSVPTSGLSGDVSVEPVELPHGSGVSQGPDVPKEDSTLVTRNIFAPLFSVPVQPSFPDLQETSSQSATAIPVEPLPPPRPMPVFLGKLRHKGMEKVFLSVAGEVYVVSPGDHFGPDNDYKLLEISKENLTVKHEGDAESFQIEAFEQPISVLATPGASYGEPMETIEPTEVNVPMEPGSLDKEVPIDKVIDE